MDGSTMIRVRDLTKVYEPEAGRRGRAAATRRPAVDEVSFDVARGELFVVMGLSGSGKSTMLRMLNRLVEPTAGSVTIGGSELTSMPSAGLRRMRNSTVNMVFQHFAIFPHRTLMENVGYGLQVRGVGADERRERSRKALDQVGLSQWGEELPSALSGGMRQRVGLARALATDAEVLLMDEPFSALDPLIRRDMQGLLLGLQAQLQKTIVFVTHDLNEAMRLGDRIMVMRDGRVVQLGNGAEILADPADEYVADFVSDVDRSRVVTAERVMHAPGFAVRENSFLPDILTRFASAPGALVHVTTDRGQLLGAISVERLHQLHSQGATSLKGVDLSEVATAAPTALLSELCAIVGRDGRTVAVVDHDGLFLGEVSSTSLLRALSTERSATDA